MVQFFRILLLWLCAVYFKMKNNFKMSARWINNNGYAAYLCHGASLHNFMPEKRIEKNYQINSFGEWFVENECNTNKNSISEQFNTILRWPVIFFFGLRQFRISNQSMVIILLRSIFRQFNQWREKRRTQRESENEREQTKKIPTLSHWLNFTIITIC